MKFKAAWKYQLSEMKRPVIIFYLIIYCIYIFMIVQWLTMKGEYGKWSSSGMEAATLIFLFVIGLNSFKSTFHLFLANGVSRRTMFESYIAALLPLAAGMAVIDSLNGLLLSLLGNYNSMFENMYFFHYGDLIWPGRTASIFFDGLVWMFFFYAFVAMAGFFITTLYYRMNKPVKLLVSIGVPVFIFMILPYVDTFIFRGEIFEAIGHIFAKAGGFLDGFNPYIAVLSCFISFAVFAGLSFLAMRKATVKQ